MMLRTSIEELIAETNRPTEEVLLKLIKIDEKSIDMIRERFRIIEAENDELRAQLRRVETMCMGRAGA